MRPIVDTFDPELLSSMGAAYDGVLHNLKCAGQESVSRNIIADFIFRLAQDGERDSGRLYDMTIWRFCPSRQLVA